MPWQLIDYRVQRQVVAAPNAPVPLGAVPQQQTWRYERLSVVLIAPGATGLGTAQPPAAYVFDQFPLNPTSIPVDATWLSAPGRGLITWGSGVLYGDFADFAAPITVMAGDQLCIVLSSNFGQGFTLLIRGQIAVYQGTAGAPQPVAGGGPPPPQTVPATL